MTLSPAALSAVDLSALDHDGAVVLRGVVPPGQVEALLPAFAARSAGRAGARSLANNSQLADLVGDGAVGRLARALLGPAARPVRLVLFDKSQDANWGVPWHQDRTIAVAARHDVPGFTAWNEKAGIVHVEPPTALLEGMLTLRLFVDDCDATNGPVEVALGTHRLGRVPAGNAARLARAHPPFLATGARGDVLVMRLLALHASKPAVAPVHRRVIHVDYCAEPLPEPLRWALPI